VTWPDRQTALAEAERRLGPVWFERARTVLFSLALEGHPARNAARRERSALERLVEAQTDPHLREALTATVSTADPTWRRAVRGPLNPECADRREFVRVLASTWRQDDPDFPGPTDWAYFDAGTGWTQPPRGAGGGWRALVATWGTELRHVGLGTETDRKRARGTS
jgi:hypothetical protein